MCIDAWYPATAPLDMRCGMDSPLARVAAVFGAAQLHVDYAFANAKARPMKVLLHDGHSLWPGARRLHKGGFVWPHEEAPRVRLRQEQWGALCVNDPRQSVVRCDSAARLGLKCGLSVSPSKHRHQLGYLAARLRVGGDGAMNLHRVQRSPRVQLTGDGCVVVRDDHRDTLGS